MAGTINKDETMRFKRLLFRASRGKVLSYFEPIDEVLKDFKGKFLEKCVYVLVFEEGTHLRDKITKICDSFQGKRYHLPEEGHADKRAF
jgi:V-type H+-transporting ATPase subunit a